MVDQVSGVILAGGHSSRLGMDKRRLRLWGTDGPNLLEHTVLTLRALCAEVIVVLNDPDDWEMLDAHLVPDVIADAGPLGGFVSGLSAAANDYALVVAADMPLLSSELLQFMMAYPRPYTALVPLLSSEVSTTIRVSTQPLHAIYRRSTHEIARLRLDSGDRKMVDFVAAIGPTYLDADTISAHDPRGISFLNVNTPDDLANIRSLLDADQ